MDVVAQSINVLIYGVSDRLDPSFRIMSNTNWGNLTVVGEESAYVHQINTVLLDIISSIRMHLTVSYYRTFCAKLAPWIMNKFLDVILKQKKITGNIACFTLLD